MEDFWFFLDQLVSSHPTVLNRPKGSSHSDRPELGYPVDYGYLEGTSTKDGEGWDVWVGSLPDKFVDAVVITVDLEHRGTKLELLLGCTEGEKRAILDMLNALSAFPCLVRRGGEMAFLRSRRSIRRFKSQRVPEQVLMHLLEAGTWAPSAHNRQPWRFAVITTMEAKVRLAEAMGEDFQKDLLADGLSPQEANSRVEQSRRRITEAPVVIVLCLDSTVGDSYPDAKRKQNEHLMGIQSVALAGGYLLLAAHAFSLGGVWMCAPLFAPQATRQALALPASWQPQALLLLGYPAEDPNPPPRRPVDEVAVFL